MRTLSCGMWDPVQFPDQISNLGPLHLEAGSLSHWTTREVPCRCCYEKQKSTKKSLKIPDPTPNSDNVYFGVRVCVLIGMCGIRKHIPFYNPVLSSSQNKVIFLHH